MRTAAYAIFFPGDKFLPPVPNNNRAGATWLEPTDKGLPRLFPQKRDAERALREWLAGKVSYVSLGLGLDTLDDPDGRYERTVQPVPERATAGAHVALVRLEKVSA